MGVWRNPWEAAPTALGRRVGRVLFLWGQGQEYGNLLRGWITPVSLATGVANYMGLGPAQAIALGCSLPVVVTAVTFAAGYWHVRLGAARSVAQHGNENDPWRTEVLDHLRSMRARGGAARRPTGALPSTSPPELAS